MEGETVSAMSSFLTSVGDFFTQSVEWLGDVLDVVVSSPPLLILVLAMPIIGFAVGLLGRLIRL